MIILQYKLSGSIVTRRVAVDGYIDKEEMTQNEVYINTYLFGILIFKRLVWIEDVPDWVMRSRATIGASDWESSRPYLINACVRKRTLKTISI